MGLMRKCDLCSVLVLFFFLFLEVAYLWTLECVLVEDDKKVCETMVDECVRPTLAVNMNMRVLILMLLFVYACVSVSVCV